MQRIGISDRRTGCAAFVIVLAVLIGLAVVVNSARSLPPAPAPAPAPEVILVEARAFYRTKSFHESTQAIAWANAQVRDGYVLHSIAGKGGWTVAVVVYAPDEAGALLLRRPPVEAG